MADINTIYSWFETGDFPTEAHFKATFASFFHKDQKIPMLSVEGLAEMFQQTATVEGLEAHFNDENAHEQYLVKKDATNIDDASREALRMKLGISNSGNVQQTFEQITAAETWNINHGTASFPKFLFLDENNVEINPDEVKYIDSNNVQVKFIPATAGKAIY